MPRRQNYKPLDDILFSLAALTKTGKKKKGDVGVDIRTIKRLRVVAGDLAEDFQTLRIKITVSLVSHLSASEASHSSRHHSFWRSRSLKTQDRGSL